MTVDASAIAIADVEHPPPWGWKVSSYFLSKGIAAGAMMLAALLLVLGARGSRLAESFPACWRWRGSRSPDVAGLGSQAAAALLLPVHPAAVALVAGARGAGDQRRGAARARIHRRGGSRQHALRDVLRWVMVPAGAVLAGYTAFLFNQCEGRDLWQSPLLLPHTIVNALLAGAARSADRLSSPPPAPARGARLDRARRRRERRLIALDLAGAPDARPSARRATCVATGSRAVLGRRRAVGGCPARRCARPFLAVGGRRGWRRRRLRAGRVVVLRGRLGAGGPERSAQLERREFDGRRN